MRVQHASKRWLRGCLLFAASFALFVLFASHPELRLLLPLIDAIGVDLFLVLLAAQVWGFVRPAVRPVFVRGALPVGRGAYRALIFLLGVLGPYVHAKMCMRFPTFAVDALAATAHS